MKKYSIVLFLGLVVNIAMAAKAAAPDLYADAWAAQISACKTLEAQLVMTRADRGTSNLWVKIDCGTGMFTGKSVTEDKDENGTDEILISEWGRTDQYSWYANANDAFRRINIGLLERSPVFNSAASESLGLRELRWCYAPFHVNLLMDQLKEPMKLTVDEKSKLAGAERHLVYELDAKNGIVAHLTYDASFSGGVRVFLAELSVNGIVVDRVANSEFEKIDGIWVAAKSHYQNFDPGAGPGSEPRDDVTLSVQSIKFNRSYTSDDFGPKPQEGDNIWDARTNTMIRNFGHPPRLHAKDSAASTQPDN